MANRVAVVSGASSGIGLGITQALLARGDAVVAISREITRKGGLKASDRLVLVEGDIGEASTSEKAVAEAVSRFGRLDLAVNNAGIFIAKPFTDHTAEDLNKLISTNVAGFLFLTQSALRQMVKQQSGNIVSIGASLAGQAIAGMPAALAMVTKGGYEAATRSLAIEYAPQGIRANTVAPGLIDTPLLLPKEQHPFLSKLTPAGRLGAVKDIVDAVLYLDGAQYVSGEIVHVDGGAHAGRW